MLVGKEFGPYVVDKELGSGSMGTVVRAKNKKTGDRPQHFQFQEGTVF